MSANAVYRVVIDNHPKIPADLDQWVQYVTEHWGMADLEYCSDDEIRERFATWRGGQRFRYFSISAARTHVKRCAKFGITAHVESGTIAWVEP